MIKQALLLTTLSLFLFSCSNESSNKTNPSDAKQMPEAIESDVVLEKATKIFYSMPSPLELTTLIKSAGGTFKGSLLHNPQLAHEYQTRQSQAMNLGIYGADLSYSSIYGQQQEAIKYLAATKRIGEKLGIHEAFSAELIERANNNLDNRDSMLHILTEIYWQSNSQLQEEDRGQTSMMIMASGWLEGLYLGSHIIDMDNPDPEVVLRLMEQKYTSAQIKEMFSQKLDDPDIAVLNAKFSDLFEFYAKLLVKEEQAVVEYVESTGVSRISGKKEINYSDEELVTLRDITESIRTQIIEG